VRRFGLIVCVLLVAITFAEAVEDAVVFDWGPIASCYRDATGDKHLRALGPIFETVRGKTEQRYLGVRPFYSRASNARFSSSSSTYLWPLASSRRLHQELNWRILLAYGHVQDSSSSDSRYQIRVLPIYFQGRSGVGENYVAVFPLGGKICEILGQDRVGFLMFPLLGWGHVQDMKFRTVLWPVFSATTGPGVYRRRVWPFYGISKKEGWWQKKFVMWPFWTSARYFRDGYSGSSYILWPLWGRVKREQQHGWMFLPPLFRFHKGDKQNLTYCPWPIIQISSGEINKLYIWPIWGRKEIPGAEKKHFALWPIFWRSTYYRADSTVHWLRAVPFVQSQVIRAKEADGTEGEIIERYHKLWPLISYRRANGVRRTRLLDLWPTKDYAVVERSWAPIWTLFQHTVAPDGFDTEFLWGLYRQARRGEDQRYVSLFPLFSWNRDDREQETREWSLLKGLLGYKRDGDKKTLRILYLLKFGIGGKE